jgi:hypothetical protein
LLSTNEAMSNSYKVKHSSAWIHKKDRKLYPVYGYHESEEQIRGNQYIM